MEVTMTTWLQPKHERKILGAGGAAALAVVLLGIFTNTAYKSVTAAALMWSAASLSMIVMGVAFVAVRRLFETPVAVVVAVLLFIKAVLVVFPLFMTRGFPVGLMEFLYHFKNVVNVLYMGMTAWVVFRGRAVLGNGLSLPVVALMLRKARFNTLIIVLLFGGLTYVFFGVGFLKWDPEGAGGVGGTIVIGILVAICGLVTVFYLRALIGLINIKGSWILKTIRDEPEEIAWIYESVARTPGVEMSGYSTVYIWFADGRNYTVQVGHTGAKEFIQALAARAPHARIGYSKEIEKLYGENPARFRPGG